ncbi:MAG: methylmalonyl Co-A mutase-associated GTPase MeaB [Nanoarchaeota archaeon]|nr:methylmalonyl Co-A mutase-associated GTPase MeaB [Nanoarchaeota archaeon]MCG2718548.1 methylmalonyl Co-A mutase-associated GTPase MeaB [Nanoarchaeota archaeon]
MKPKDLVKKILECDMRGIGKAISLAENEIRGYKKVLKKIKKHTGNAHIIGITGFPGAGKSTLIRCIIEEYLEQDNKVGVVAVDPSSLSGGSILGDRVRMHIKDYLSYSNNLFIRSMPSRGHTGGLAKGTSNAVKILDAAGYEKIIVETVGAGQSDIDIMNIAHTSIVVVTPGMGGIQTIKGGIMEIADLYVINKADLPGSYITESEIKQMIGFKKNDKNWTPEVYKTQANNDKGIKELIEGIEKHYEFIKKNK